jgi:hypothetical protein
MCQPAGGASVAIDAPPAGWHILLGISLRQKITLNSLQNKSSS